jgi:hypothetical protein
MGTGREPFEGITLTKTESLQKHLNKTSEQYSLLRNEDRTGHVIITRFCNPFIT